MINFNIAEFMEALMVRSEKRIKNNSTNRNFNLALKGVIKPRKKTIIKYLSKLGFEVDEHLKIYLPYQTLENEHLCEELFYFLENENIQGASSNIEKLKTEEAFQNGLNLQFLLSCEAKLEILNGNNDIFPLVKKAMYITYKNFRYNNFDSKLLLFQEIELMVTLSRSYENKGDLKRSFSILSMLADGLRKLPLNDQVKKKEYIRVLTLLINFLIKEKRIEEAIKCCDEAFNFSKNICEGYKLIDIIHLMSICKFELKDIEQSKILFQSVFWGYVFYKNRNKAKKILEDFKQKFKEDLNIYGLEIDKIEPPNFKFFKCADIKSIENIGQLMFEVRAAKNLNQEQLSYGIIDRTSYGKFELDGVKEISIYQQEALLQRLGLDPVKYCYYFLTDEEFKDYQTYKEIPYYIFIRDLGKVKSLLKQLENKSYFQNYVGKQFILFVKSFIYSSENGYNKKYLDLVYEALNISIKNFDETKIMDYYLNYREIVLINSIGTYYYNKNDYERAAKIYSSLLKNIEKNYIDEKEQTKIYSFILFNYCTVMIELDYYEEVINLSEKGVYMNISTESFLSIPNFAISMGEALFKNNEKEKSIAYLVGAYFTARLILLDSDAEDLKHYLENKLKINI